MNDKISVLQAYLSMCEYIYKELELNNWKEVDLRSVISEIELEGEWQSADPGAISQFEEAVKVVLSGNSRFECVE